MFATKRPPYPALDAFAGVVLGGDEIDDRAGEQVAVAARAPGHQVAVDHDVLVGVDRAHVHHVAVEVVVGDHRTAADQLRHRRHQPHAVADDALDDVGLGEGAGQELRRGRELVDVLGVAQPVRHDRRRAR